MTTPEKLLARRIMRDRAIEPAAKVKDVHAEMYIEDLEDCRVILEGWVEFRSAGHFEAFYILGGPGYL